MQMYRAPKTSRGVTTLMHVGHVPQGIDRNQAASYSRVAAIAGAGVWALGAVTDSSDLRGLGFWVGVSALATHLLNR